MSNIKNSNEKFQNILDCNFNQHWSWSILFKNLGILEQINKLSQFASVLEVGAANSYLEDYTRSNLKRKDICFCKLDINPEYKDIEGMQIGDIADYELELLYEDRRFDLIIISEVIEHLQNENYVPRALNNIYTLLKDEGIMVLTTPTPNKLIDDMVWPDDHSYELSLDELCWAVNKNFEIELLMPWSLKKRDYNYLIENDKLVKEVYVSLREKLPEGVIRAIVALFSPIDYARQILLVCKKRRVPNA